MNNTIGSRIKDLRHKKGLPQVDLARLIGVSKQTLYKYENDVITNIPSDKIEALAHVLDTTPSYLMGWDTVQGYIDHDNELDIETNKTRYQKKIARSINEFSFLQLSSNKTPTKYIGTVNANFPPLVYKINDEYMASVAEKCRSLLEIAKTCSPEQIEKATEMLLGLKKEEAAARQLQEQINELKRQLNDKHTYKNTKTENKFSSSERILNIDIPKDIT